MFWLVPRPASLKETVSVPLLFRDPLALMKCSFWANAAEAAKANSSMDSTAIIPTRLIYFLPSLVPMAQQGPTGIDWKRSLSRGDVRGAGEMVPIPKPGFPFLACGASTRASYLLSLEAKAKPAHLSH